MSDAEEIEQIIVQRNIAEIVHFTSNHGVVGAFVSGQLISRRQLPAEEHLAYLAAPTSAQRQEAMAHFDKAKDWLDFINLSISEININYFNIASNKWHVAGDRWWAILAFRPEILKDDGVYFATTNNVYEDHVSRNMHAEGLNALFAPVIKRKGNWRAMRSNRESRLPTCQQAEVLYPGALSIAHLFRIYVRTGDEHDIVSSWLRMFKKNNIEIVISPEKFFGMPN